MAGEARYRERPETEDEARITLRLTADAYTSVRRIQQMLKAATVAEAIRRSIGTLEFLLEEIDKGNEVLIKGKDKSVQRVVLK